MKILPLQDRILIRRAPEEEKTKGGLFIPNTAQEKSLEAEVIAVGPGRFLKATRSRPRISTAASARARKSKTTRSAITRRSSKRAFPSRWSTTACWMRTTSASSRC